jgi:hypothetical protein
MTPLVYVWLGDQIPEWVSKALYLARKTCDLELHLVLSKKIILSCEGVNKYYLEDFYCQHKFFEDAYKSESSNERNGFWIKTIERFFVLEQFMVKAKFSTVFHAELDNIVFSLKSLGEMLNAVGSGLFCPRDSNHRGIASLIYVNNINTLQDLNKYYINNYKNIENDMQLLGSALSTGKDFYSLPNESLFSRDGRALWDSVDPLRIGGIFDSAAIGQYLFGTDPSNYAGRIFNGVVNENSGCDLSDLQFIALNKGYAMAIKSKKLSNHINIYNLHIHSKAFSQISDLSWYQMVLNDISCGKKTLIDLNISRWRYIGRFIRIFFLFLKAINIPSKKGGA